VFLDYGEDVYEAVAARFRRAGPGPDHRAQAGAEAETDRVKALAQEKLAERFEGRESEISASFRSLTKKLVRERVIRDGSASTAAA